MTGVLGSDKAESAIFRASINSASLPAVGATDVPSRRTWIAHGLCKEVETEAYEVAATSTDSTDGSTTASCSFATESGTDGGADSGTNGGCQGGGHGWERHCARWCAHYCARYCARYCGLGGYGYGFGLGYGFGFGYGYSYARGYSTECIAIATRGDTSWTQIVPSGFTVTTWLYYEETTNA